MLNTRALLKAILIPGAVAIVLFTPPRAFPQSEAAGGAIEGTITDQSGGALPGASVKVRNEGTGVTRETASDSKGLYHAPLLPVGTYTVTVDLQGFRAESRSHFLLTVGQTLRVDVSLTVGSAESVTVIAQAPVLEVARTQQSSTVSERLVGNLPVNGRNFIDFVLTTPGVTRDVRQGDLSFAGQRGTLNSLVVDGADDNNTFFGQAAGRTGSGRAPYQFSQDAVQEFQVNRNAYSAEYGRAGGAVVNVVTKSGTNDYHGSAFEFFRDKSLNANSWNNKIFTPARPRSPYHFNQFGGSVGGPLAKDKAFFFVSYDGQRNTQPNDLILNTAGLPADPLTQAGLSSLESQASSWSRTFDQDVFLAKVDWQLNNEHRLTIRYNHQNFTGGNLENGGPQNAFSHTGDSDVQTRTANASLTSVFSSTTFNELRVQYAKDSEPGLANSALPEANISQSGQRFLSIGRNFFSPRETTINRFQVADSVTLVRGRHAVKFGGDFNKDSIKNFFPGNFSGSYTFNSIADFAKGIPNGPGERYVQAFAGAGTTGPETHPDITEFAAFVQDEWRVRKDLTVTLGLRYDIQSFAQPPVKNPDPQLVAAGIDTSFLNTDKGEIGPRLGLAWNPNSKTVFRAGYGIFYGRTPSIMVGTAHSNNGINVETITFTGNLVPTYPNTISSLPTGVALPKPTIFVFAPDYKNPRVHQASAGVEYALTDDIALGVSYLFVKGQNLQRSTDFNVGAPVATQIPIKGGGSLTVERFPSVRRFSDFARIIRFESTADSTYNGATVEIRKRFSGRFQGRLAYTLGKVTDNVPDATAVVPASGDDAKFASNPANFEADRAAGNNDQRHRLVLSGYWDMSYFKDSKGLARVLLDGWSMSFIAFVQSGQPYSELVTNDLNNDGNNRNDIVPGSRNAVYLPSSEDVDLRLSRRFALGAKARLEIIAEAFNLLNHTNITSRQSVFYNYDPRNNILIPQQNLANPRLNFGADSGALDPRIIQLAAKLTF